MKIYTKTGDAGQTGLFGGRRVSKADGRVEAYGDVDELNSVLGLARAAGLAPDVDALLARVQCELFDLGAELGAASAEGGASPRIDDAAALRLEAEIDRFEEELPPLRAFVLPGGALAAAHLHLARTVCRRAERRMVALADREPVRAQALRYVNRLSDLLFVLARVANARASVPDVPWVGRDRVDRS